LPGSVPFSQVDLHTVASEDSPLAGVAHTDAQPGRLAVMQ